MAAQSPARPDLLRVLSWGVVAVHLLLLPAGQLLSSRRTEVVSVSQASGLVALFGDSWTQPTGDLHVTGGRIEGPRVEVYFAGPARRAELALLPRDQNPEPQDGSWRVEAPGTSVTAAIRCDPRCPTEYRQRLSALALRVLEQRPERFWEEAAGFTAGRQRLVALLYAISLAVSLGAMAFVGLLRGSPPDVAPWLAGPGIAALGCLAATVLVGEPSVSNWYSNNLATGSALWTVEDQNGVAGFLLQAVARALIPWSGRTLFALNLVLHALTASLWFLSFRLLSGARTAACSLALWAVLPMTVRLGWSDAQHVQVGLLFALLLLLWLRAQYDSGYLERATACLLVLLLPLVRLEALTLLPIPLLLGWFAGERRLSGRLLDSLLYGLAVAAASWSVFDLFIWRYEMPITDALVRRAALVRPQTYVDLFTQFLVVESGMPNWFPGPATLLAALGSAVLALRRPALFGAVVICFAVPQLFLGRLLNAEGLVGARYFLPQIALLAFVAATGVTALGDALGSLAKGRAAAFLRSFVPAACVVVVMLASLPLYHYRYAFQDEYDFLSAALAGLPADSTILHFPVRGDQLIHGDPDCCLDLPHSPLTLSFPRMRFEAIPLRDHDAAFPGPLGDHTYYYSGALCSLAPTRSSEKRTPGLSALVQQMCARLEQDPRLDRVARTRGSSNGFWEFLSPGGVPLELYRVRTEPRTPR